MRDPREDGPPPSPLRGQTIQPVIGTRAQRRAAHQANAATARRVRRAAARQQKRDRL